jgi:uncharacterized membrane protein
MEKSQRFFAFIVYILPVIGWIYVGLFQRKNYLAKFHLRQVVGLVLYLIIITAVWALITWMLAWIPYAFILGIVLFTLPITAYILGAVAWLAGMVYALLGRTTPLPLIGGYSSRLPL